MSHNIPPQCLGAWRVGQKKGTGPRSTYRLTDHSKQMRSLLSQGQPTLATLNCTSLRNPQLPLQALEAALAAQQHIRHWLSDNIDITALAHATHRRTHANTHTWGKYTQTPPRNTHARTPQQRKTFAQKNPARAQQVVAQASTNTQMSQGLFPSDC